MIYLSTVQYALVFGCMAGVFLRIVVFCLSLRSGQNLLTINPSVSDALSLVEKTTQSFPKTEATRQNSLYDTLQYTIYAYNTCAQISLESRFSHWTWQGIHVALDWLLALEYTLELAGK